MSVAGELADLLFTHRLEMSTGVYVEAMRLVLLLRNTGEVGNPDTQSDDSPDYLRPTIPDEHITEPLVSGLRSLVHAIWTPMSDNWWSTGIERDLGYD